MTREDQGSLLEERSATCPVCWETISFVLDLSAGAQSYVEDCAVCCRPLIVRYHLDTDGALVLDVEAESP